MDRSAYAPENMLYLASSIVSAEYFKNHNIMNVYPLRILISCLILFYSCVIISMSVPFLKLSNQGIIVVIKNTLSNSGMSRS